MSFDDASLSNSLSNWLIDSVYLTNSSLNDSSVSFSQLFKSSLVDSCSSTSESRRSFHLFYYVYHSSSHFLPEVNVDFLAVTSYSVTLLTFLSVGNTDFSSWSVFISVSINVFYSVRVFSTYFRYSFWSFKETIAVIFTFDIRYEFKN